MWKFASFILASVLIPALSMTVAAQDADSISCAMTKPAPEITALIYGQHAGRYEFRFTDGPLRVRRSLLDTLDLEAAPDDSPGEFIIDRLGIGSHVFEQVPVRAWDPPPMYPEGEVPDGLLTLDVFKDRLVTLDVANGVLRINEGSLADSPDAVVYEIREGEGGGRDVFIDSQLGGKPLELALSANAQTTLHFSNAAAKELPLKGEPGLVGRVITEKGESTISGARLALPLVAGGLVLQSAGVRFSDLFEAPTLGIGSLTEHAITFDHANRRLRFSDAAPIVDDAPAGAISIIDDSLNSLREAFNRDKERTRLVMILSPT